MNAYSRFIFSFTGNNPERAYDVIKNTIKDVEYSASADFSITDTYDCVFEEDIEALVKNIAKSAPDITFSVSGTIDTSESAGELKDFIVTYGNNKLTVQYSDWYIETSMDCYDDYDDFCDGFAECTEEEYEKIKKLDFVYLLETDNGEILSSTVPMAEIKELTIN